MPKDYSLVSVHTQELMDIGLTRELSDLDPGEPAEAYQFEFFGERGRQAGRQPGELLFLPQRGRAGIAWGGEAVWTDASSTDEAMERYLDHTIFDDSPEE